MLLEQSWRFIRILASRVESPLCISVFRTWNNCRKWERNKAKQNEFSKYRREWEWKNEIHEKEGDTGKKGL